MKAMGRFLPTPTLSLVLLVVWLLMVRSIAPGQLLLGTVLAVGIPLLTQGFWSRCRGSSIRSNWSGSCSW